MSDNATHSHDKDGMSGQSIHPNKSSWMTHRSQTSYKSSPQACDHLPLRHKSKGDNHESTRSFLGDREISSDFLKSGKRFREVVEASQVKFLNKKGIDSCSFPVFDMYQNRESALSSKNKQLAISSKEVIESPVDHISRYNNLTLVSNESSLKRNHFHHEGTVENFGQRAKDQHFHENDTLDTSRSFQGDFMGSATNVMHGFNTEKTENNKHLDSRLPMKEQFRSTVTHVELERENYRNFSALLMRGEKMNKHLNSISSPDSLFGESYQKIQKKSENDDHGCYSQQQMPHSAHNVEMVRVYSQTTHHMLITTKPDVNTTEGEVRGNTFTELLNLFPDLGSHGRTGLKLQPLESSPNIVDVKTSAVDSNNESSAEIDIMAMGATFKENYQLTELALSLSTKAGENASLSQLEPSSNNEQIREKSLYTELLDINEEPPSTTKTRGLDVDQLLPISGNWKSIISPVDISGPEPNSRCIKRLKMSATNCFVYGSKIGESSSSREKVEKPLIFPKEIVTSSEPRSDAHQITLLLKNCESPSVEEHVKKGKEDIMISHSWIRRWCRNSRASCPKKNYEREVVCEPESSKVALEKYQKEQFPSTAAMVLMGKAMNGFRPCEFMKRGSFLVWNTKEL